MPKIAMRNQENRWTRYRSDAASGTRARTAKLVTGVRFKLRNAMK
jgi:hypothetical protein